MADWGAIAAIVTVFCFVWGVLKNIYKDYFDKNKEDAITKAGGSLPEYVTGLLKDRLPDKKFYETQVVALVKVIEEARSGEMYFDSFTIWGLIAVGSISITLILPNFQESANYAALVAAVVSIIAINNMNKAKKIVSNFLDKGELPDIDI